MSSTTATTSANPTTTDDDSTSAGTQGDGSTSGGVSSGDDGGNVTEPEEGVIKFEGEVEGMPFTGRCDDTNGMLVSSGLAGNLTVSCTVPGMSQHVFVILTDDPESPFSFGPGEAPPTSPTHSFTLDASLTSSQPAMALSSVLEHLEAITVDGTWDTATGRLTWTFDATWADAPDMPGFFNGSVRGSGDIVITER